MKLLNHDGIYSSTDVHFILFQHLILLVLFLCKSNSSLLFNMNSDLCRL